MKRLISACLLIGGLLSAPAIYPIRVAANEPAGTPTKFGENKGRAGYDATITVTPGGIYVEVHSRGSYPGTNGAPGTNGGKEEQPGSPDGTGQPGSSLPSGGTVSWYDPTRGYFNRTGDGHVFSLEPISVGNAGRGGWFDEGKKENPDSDPWGFYVDGKFQGIVWLPRNMPAGGINWGTPPATSSQPPSGGGNPGTPYDVAFDMLAHAPLPNIQIRVNPALGLVAVPGWFWIEGYDGRPFGTSRTIPIPPEVGSDTPLDEVPADDPRRQWTSLVIDVEIWASKYQWSFGDGGSMMTQSLGQAFPSASEIRHTYEHSSLGSPGGFPVRITVEFAAQFRINGGAPQPLPPIQRAYEARYMVQEAQAVLANR